MLQLFSEVVAQPSALNHQPDAAFYPRPQAIRSQIQFLETLCR